MNHESCPCDLLEHCSRESHGQTVRLLSCMRDCPDGWTFCFDVKERPDGTAILTHVRVVRTRSPQQAERESTDSDKERTPTTMASLVDAVDCTEPESQQHPAHQGLLRLFHQPKQQMLDCEYWKNLVQHRLTIKGAEGLKETDFTDVFNSVGPKELLHEVEKAKANLQEQGYCRFCRLQLSSEAMSNTVWAMEKLQELGFPPVACAQIEATQFHVFSVCTSNGCGSKSKTLGTTGFYSFCLLPIKFFGYPFSTHSQVSLQKSHNIPDAFEKPTVFQLTLLWPKRVALRSLFLCLMSPGRCSSNSSNRLPHSWGEMLAKSTWAFQPPAWQACSVWICSVLRGFWKIHLITSFVRKALMIKTSRKMIRNQYKQPGRWETKTERAFCA